MANNTGNFGGSAFSGFPGGYDSVPGVGNVSPATFNIAGTGTLGANLPHVDPNNFQGTVHWGPENVLLGSQAGQLPSSGGAPGSGFGSY